MNHLSGMDAAFLHLETPEMPMHVGGFLILDLPEGFKGEFWEDVKTHIGSRMHLAPLFTRKLALMPFELANPVWVEDDDIDLDYHVRRVTLPRPGTRAQLEAYVGRLHSSLLDRSRPLWECYVIDGLKTGQSAFYVKTHHAGMDGAAGAVLANAILDSTEEPRTVRPPPTRRGRQGYQLGIAELAGAALKNAAVQYFKLIKLTPTMAKVAMSIKPPRPAKGATGLAASLGITLAPRTAFNVAITNQRVFAALSLPLAEVKGIAKPLGATVNDVVMAMCSGALRQYFLERDSLPAKQLLASVPVSLREAGNTEMNNQATTMTVGLATDLADPLARLRAIHDAAIEAKEYTGNVKAAIPSDFPSFGAPWLISGMASMLGRTKLVNALPPTTNLVISNVPGPQTPLYLARAKVASNYPVSIPAHGMALNITVSSYNGMLDFGLTACRRAVPDVAELARHLRDALTELKAAAAAALPPPESIITSPLPSSRKSPRRSLTTRSTPKPALKKPPKGQHRRVATKTTV